MQAVVRSEFLQFKAIAAELAQENYSMFMSRFAVCFLQMFVFCLVLLVLVSLFLIFFSFFQNVLFPNISMEWTYHSVGGGGRAHRAVAGCRSSDERCGVWCGHVTGDGSFQSYFLRDEGG